LIVDSEELKRDINHTDDKISNAEERISAVESRLAKCESDNDTVAKFFWLSLTGILAFGGAVVVKVFKG